MLRSFHYAISSSLLQRIATLPEDAAFLRSWAEVWYSYVAGSFLRAYVAAAVPAKLVPADPLEFENVLQAFLLEKAVYEVGYEINNRPDWLAIPMRGIFQVLGAAAAMTAA